MSGGGFFLSKIFMKKQQEIDPYHIPATAVSCLPTRKFLAKVCDGSLNTLDSVVQNLLVQVESKIDCRECGKCCMSAYPVVEESDKAALCDAMNVTSAQLNEHYLDFDDDGHQVFKQQPCPLLIDTQCSIYENRMQGCRDYPHLQQSNFASRLQMHQYNYARCPQVYHLVELLKEQV